MPFRRILSAVDFSPDSVAAFRVAVEMARLHDGSLHVLHVVEAQPAVSEPIPTRGAGEMTVEVVAEANAAMETLVASDPSLARVPFTTEVTAGYAAVEIPARAREWRADAVVLGAKGIAS